MIILDLNFLKYTKYKTSINNCNMETATADTILKELDSKIELAIKHNLIPNKLYTEIEFTCDTHGQATEIEFWRCSKRLKKDYNAVQIPCSLLKHFVFKKSFS